MMPSTSLAPRTKQRRDASLTLVSEVPHEHPQKHAVDQTLCELAGLPGGPWRVELRVGQALGWWFIKVYAETSRFRRTLVIGPEQQTAEFVRDAWYRAWLASDAAVRTGFPAE